MELVGDIKEDQLLQWFEGVYNEDVELLMYLKMMVMLLDQVNKVFEEKKLDDWYKVMLEEIQDYENKVKMFIKEQKEKFVDLQKQEGKKIMSEGLCMGFDSFYVVKVEVGDKEKKVGGFGMSVELLNLNFLGLMLELLGQFMMFLDDEEEVEVLFVGKKFVVIKLNDFVESYRFLFVNL